MGIRDRLKNRSRPQATVKLRIDTTPEFARKEKELAFLDGALTQATFQEDQEKITSIQARLDVLRAEVAGGYEDVVIEALAPMDFEALIAEHPPTKEQEGDGFNWNRDTFFPALLAACVQGDESAEDWKEIIANGEIVLGEFNALVGTALDLNDRSPDVMLGKGLGTTLS